MNRTRRDLLKCVGGMLLAPAIVSAGQRSAEAQIASTVVGPDPTRYMDHSTALLQAIVPGEEDFQGFLRQSFSSKQPAGLVGAFYLDQFEGKVIPDVFHLDVDLSKAPFNRLNQGHVSTLERVLFSADGFWSINLQVHFCDPVETAKSYLNESTLGMQAVWKQGTLLGTVPIGDESRIIDASSKYDLLLFRFGPIVARVEMNSTGNSEAYGITLEAPLSLVEAIAHMIMLKASRQPFMSYRSTSKKPAGPPKPYFSAADFGVPEPVDLSVPVRVNGELLPLHSCQQFGGQTYIPVLTFADAAYQDLSARWEANVGALMLYSSFTGVTLAAGSIIVKEGPPVKKTLKVPLLKDGNDPYMALDDLLSLLPRAKAQPEGPGFSVQTSAI